MKSDFQSFRIFLLATLLVIFSSHSLFSENGIQFKSDYTIFVENLQKTNISITVFIPYNQLNFTIEDTLFKAEVDISAILYKKSKQIGGEIWRKKVLLKDYEKTNSGNEGITWTFDFGSQPGKFDLHINVKDLNSQKEGKKIEKIEVIDIEKEGFWVSKPAFSLIKEGDEKGWLIPGDLNVELDSIFSFVKIVADTAHMGEYLLRYQALDEKKNPFLKLNKYIEIDSMVKKVFLTFPIKEFQEGDYTIFVELIKEGKTIARSSKTITINFPFFLSKRYLIRVEQMSYITNNKEMKKLKESKPDEREKAWNEFWSKEDPIPETPASETLEEYFRRVDFANENFSSFQSGWRTDRGRIYIIYGKPDEIEHHPFEKDAPPYQIWYYYNLGKRFIFADLSMTGDYTQIRERDENFR